MYSYVNVMEELVEQSYDSVKNTLNCCQCEICRNDIIACALNLLPPKYVVLEKGSVYSKNYILKNRMMSDIMAALVKAAEIVNKNPRHQMS